MMIEISRAQLDMLAHRLPPEAPGPNTIGAHFLRTGIGRAWVDCWPDAQAIIVDTANNLLMLGDPAVLQPAELAQTIAGFVAAPEPFVPLLEAAFPTLYKWPRIVGMLPGKPNEPPAVDADLRRFRPEDGADLEMLSAESIWVSNPWGDGKALAQSGYGWGAWVDGVLASVASTFFLGNEYEEIAVVTEPGYRGAGLSTACTYELCLDILARGRKPGWSTSTDNVASWRVAEKLGFVHQRDDWLYIAGREKP